MCAPAMQAAGKGSITIISSIGGLKGSPILGAYAISKAADMQMARNLADEFGPQGVRVNCIAPGLITNAFAPALWSNPATLALSTRRSRSDARRVGNQGCRPGRARGVPYH